MGFVGIYLQVFCGFILLEVACCFIDGLAIQFNGMIYQNTITFLYEFYGRGRFLFHCSKQLKTPQDGMNNMSMYLLMKPTRSFDF